MKFEKKNYQYMTQLKIVRTGSDLDGTLVNMVGVSSRGVVDIYIVEFSDGVLRTSIEQFNQDPVQFKSLTLPEYCLPENKTPAHWERF